MKLTPVFVSLALLAQPVLAQPYPDVPKAGAARPFTIAQPIVETLPNGLQVVVVERHSLPIVSAVLLVRSGSELDPPPLAGLAATTADLLTEGVRAGDGRRAMGAPEIAAAAEALGGSLGSSASWHGSTVGITVTAPKLGAALDLVQAVVRRPAFDPEEIDRNRAQALDGLRVSLSQPGTIAGRVATKVVFGTSPYGHSPSGTPESMQRLKRDDIVAFHSRAYRPDNATLILAGDIGPPEAMKLARQWFGSWRKPAGALPVEPQALATPAASGAPTAIVVDVPGAGQAAGLVVLPSIARSAPDYFAGIVANTILGGSYSSRLGTEVRIKRGLSYGATSALDARRLGGSLSLSAQTKNESAYELVGVMRSELARMADEPTALEELEARKATLVGDVVRSLETTAGLASRVAGLIIGGVPIDEISNWSARVQAVTPADVQAFAKAHWPASTAQVIIAGDAGKFGTAGAPASVKRIEADKLDFDGAALER
ncbi:hypothetical protein BH10PSE17_BH10PSE17_10540 [soil metagenome]